MKSFILQLFEAVEHQLIILASELDYVRDNIDPIQSFDPNSTISISRAVKRFLEIKKDPIKIYTSEKMKLGSAFMNNKIQILGKYNNVNTTAYRPNNRTIRRKKDERIEVRFFGGEDYHKKYDVFRRVLGELLHAMDVASDPDREIKKYYKSLYKIINDGEKKNEK